MDWRKKLLSLIAAVTMLSGIYYLFRLGAIALSEVGAALVAFLITAIAGVLWWGWRETIESSIKKPNEGNLSRSKELENELTLLISPLYAKLNRNSEIDDYMTTFITEKVWKYPPKDRKTTELEKLDADIKEIMRQHAHLAPDSIYDEIQNFFNLNPEYKPDNSWEAKKTLWKIKELAKSRQGELRAELKK